MVWVNVCHFLYKWKHLDAEVCPEVRTVEALTHKVAGRQLVEEMSWADWWRQRSATCTEGPHTHKVTYCWQPTHWWLLWRCQVPCPSLWFHWSLFDSVVSLLNCTQLTLCWALVLCGCVCQHQCSPKKMLHNLRNRRLLRIWRMLTFFRWVSTSQTWWCVLIFYLSRFFLHSSFVILFVWHGWVPWLSGVSCHAGARRCQWPSPSASTEKHSFTNANLSGLGE